jgi:hypothetical protein
VSKNFIVVKDPVMEQLYVHDFKRNLEMLRHGINDAYQKYIS